MHPETADNIRWAVAMLLAVIGCAIAVGASAGSSAEAEEASAQPNEEPVTETAADAVAPIEAAIPTYSTDALPALVKKTDVPVELPYPAIAGVDRARLIDLPVIEPDLPRPVQSGYFDEVTLVFTGDNLLGAGMPRYIKQHGEDWPYDAVRSYLVNADLTFGNLESPITDYPHKTPGKSWESIKEGRNFIFKAPPEYSGRVLTAAGFDIVSLANNHAMDYCEQGMADTVMSLDAAGIRYAGAGLDLDRAFAPVVMNRKGVRIGFIARSKIVPMRSKATEDTPGLAWHGKEYSEELSSAIRELRPICDVLVVTFHWGYEGHRRHAPYQQAIAHSAIDDGADLVIGHHPHCLQGVELYNGGVIAYSLGNFLFTGASALIESAVLKVTAGRDGVREVELLPCWVRRGKPEPAWDDRLLRKIQGICDPCGTELVGGEGWLRVLPAAKPAPAVP